MGQFKIKNFMVTIVIMLLYMNGIQGMDENINMVDLIGATENNQIEEYMKNWWNETIMKEFEKEIDRKKNLWMPSKIEMETIKSENVENKEFYDKMIGKNLDVKKYQAGEKLAILPVNQFIEIILNSDNRDDLTIKPEALEPVNFIKSVLLFAGLTPENFNAIRKSQGEDRSYKSNKWMPRLIERFFNAQIYYLLNKNSSFIDYMIKENYEIAMKSPGDRKEYLQEKLILKKENMNMIIKALPYIFYLNVDIYVRRDGQFTLKETNKDDIQIYSQITKGLRLKRILIYEQCTTSYMPLRSILEIKNEFPNLNYLNIDIDSSNYETISGENYNFKSSEANLDPNYIELIKKDIEDFMRAICDYHVNEDYHEKDMKKVEQLNELYFYLLFASQENVDEKAKAIMETVFHLKVENQIIKADKVKKQLGVSLTNENIISLSQCMDLYIEDWRDVDDDTFHFLLQNCMIFHKTAHKIEDSKNIRYVDRRITDKLKLQLVDFFIWYVRRLYISHEEIEAILAKWRKWGIYIPMSLTFLLSVFEFCSDWKEDILGEYAKGEIVKFYDIKLSMSVLEIVGLWFGYLFGISESLSSPIFATNISIVQNIKIHKEESISCWNEYLKNFFYKWLLFGNLREAIGKIFHHLEHVIFPDDSYTVTTWQVVSSLGQKLILWNLIAFNLIHYFREKIGLENELMPWVVVWKYFHVDLVLAKTIFIEYCAKFMRMHGFYEPNIIDTMIDGENVGSAFVQDIKTEFSVMMPLLMLVGFVVVLVKIFKFTIVGLFKHNDTGRSGEGAAMSSKFFQDQFHTTRDPSAGMLDLWFSELRSGKTRNWRGPASTMFLFIFFKTLKSYLLPWMAEDTGDGLGIIMGILEWYAFKMLPNVLHKIITATSDYQLNLDDSSYTIPLTQIVVRKDSLYLGYLLAVAWAYAGLLFLPLVDLNYGYFHDFQYVGGMMVKTICIIISFDAINVAYTGVRSAYNYFYSKISQNDGMKCDVPASENKGCLMNIFSKGKSLVKSIFGSNNTAEDHIELNLQQPLITDNVEAEGHNINNINV